MKNKQTNIGETIFFIKMTILYLVGLFAFAVNCSGHTSNEAIWKLCAAGALLCAGMGILCACIVIHEFKKA